jgi:redox-sensitive bicupin YhaK (pirin superfamily)
MDQTRKIQKVFRSKPTIEGAGVHLKRAFGFREPTLFDPFLLLDDFRSDNPAYYIKGFPWHPHRGIETITYMLDGRVEHGDSLGNAGIISPGDVQWMTAGSGIIHQEMPKGDSDGKMGGFQLWANLPADSKMMTPRYRDVKATRYPRSNRRAAPESKIISGDVGDISGPVRDIVIDPLYLDVTVPPRSEFSFPIDPEHNVFAYVIFGRSYFCKERDPFSYDTEGSNYF